MSHPPPVRFGLIGYGSWAERLHIPSILSAPSAELAAICGPDAGRAAAMAARYGARFSADQAQRLIDSPDVDAVLICSPNDAHAAAAIAAARSGKHVLCEKPLARTLSEARAMLAAAQAAGIRHMTAFTWRQVPAAQLAQRLVADGSIGRVFQVGAHFLHGGWLAVDARRPWRFDRRRAGSGILGDLGVHLFDMLAWVVGQPITRVCARLSTFGPKPDVPDQAPVFDDGHVLVEFAGGARGSLRISRVAASSRQLPFPDMHQGLEIYGETGAVVYDLHQHSRLCLRRPRSPAAWLDAPGALPDSGDEWVVTGEMGRRQIERFAQAIRSSPDVAPSFVEGCRAQAVMDAAERSQAVDAWVDVEQA